MGKTEGSSIRKLKERPSGINFSLSYEPCSHCHLFLSSHLETSSSSTQCPSTGRPTWTRPIFYLVLSMIMLAKEDTCHDMELFSFWNEGIVRKMTRQSPDILAFIAMP